MKKQARGAWAMVAVCVALGSAIALRTSYHPGPPGGARHKDDGRAQRGAPSHGVDHPLSWAPRGRGADNPGARSVREAHETHEHPERLSPLLAPRPFDRQAFDANPNAYLGVVEPGRCFQTENHPGPNSVALQALGSITPVPDEKGTVTLSIQTAPSAPVTFTSFGPGYFSENNLNSISVQADVQGLAVAHYAVVRGALASVPIVVGSPYATGNQTFFIATGPERLASNGNAKGVR